MSSADDDYADQPDAARSGRGAHSSPTLRIAIIGAGRIGSALAHLLAGAGHRMTVVARAGSERLRQLRRNNGVRLATGVVARVRIADALDADEAFDLVIVAVQAGRLAPVLPQLRASPALAIHFMCVTFQAERLAAAVGADRCSFGMPLFTAAIDEDGDLTMRVGKRRAALHSSRSVVTLFDGAGLPSAYEPHMPLWLRCHTPLTIAFETICVAAAHRGTGASWRQSLAVAKGLRSGLSVVERLEGRLHPKAKARLAATPTPLLAGMLWSLSRIGSVRELLASGVVEARALTVDLLAAAEDLDAPIGTEIADLNRMTRDY